MKKNDIFNLVTDLITEHEEMETAIMNAVRKRLDLLEEILKIDKRKNTDAATYSLLHEIEIQGILEFITALAMTKGSPKQKAEELNKRFVVRYKIKL
jgi:hypothetical protein